MASIPVPTAHYTETTSDNPPAPNASAAPASRHEQDDCLRQSRAAQTQWSALSIESRLQVLRRIRHGLAAQAKGLTALLANTSQRPTAEVLSGELLPLLDAGRFLERRAARILAPRRLGFSGRPLWINLALSEVERTAYGVVLILGPANNPLFIPGVQCLQALAAGNAIWLKPGTGTGAIAERFFQIAVDAGLDPGLLRILPDTIEAAQAALAADVDKAVLTGSVETGRAVLAELAPRLKPAALELSGNDAVFVRADADLNMVVNALSFGLRFNHGAACIAPRRVFVHQAHAAELENAVVTACEALALTASCCDAPARAAAEAITEAMGDGARLIHGKISDDATLAAPIVLADVHTGMRIVRESYGVPILCIVSIENDESALQQINHSPYGLGAAIFSADETAARELAGQLRCGVVTINDLMVPTADPRLPFGGCKDSGYGVTRGEEGLLDMTRPKVITTSRGTWRPHFDTAMTSDEHGFHQYVQVCHAGSLVKRISAFIGLAAYLVWTNLTQPDRRPFFRRAPDKPTDE
jgi:acyl-CoA reductase-like NAD-dependent aldehyde dehydrogenase